MLSKIDKELLRCMLDEHDYAWVLALIERAYNEGYECGYHDGWCNCYDNSVI